MAFNPFTQGFFGANQQSQAQPSWFGSRMQSPMFQASFRQRQPFMNYLPLLLSRGFMRANQAQQQPQLPTAAQSGINTNQAALQAAQARMQQAMPAPPTFQAQSAVQPQPIQPAPIPQAPVDPALAWSPQFGPKPAPEYIKYDVRNPYGFFSSGFGGGTNDAGDAP